MGKNVVYRREFLLDQLLERIYGIDSDVEAVVLESRYKLGNRLRLVEGFPAEDRYPVVFFALAHNLSDDR